MVAPRIRSVVVGTDFSSTSLDGAVWACTHLCPSASVALVHVIDPPDRPAFASHLLPPADTIEALAREDAGRRLLDAASRFSGRPVRREIRLGKPYAEIDQAASDDGADLIIIGPHGGRPRPHRFLGTTAGRIVRSAHVPVLVTTNPPPGRPNRILVPVDDSSATEPLLDWARALAGELDAHVMLLHVWSNAVYSHVASMSYATEPSDEAARAEIAHELNEVAMQWLNTLARRGMPPDRVSAKVMYGDASDAILETAKEAPADLIMMGRRGTGLVVPALLGSTVGRVLHEARMPILVV